MPDLTKRFIPSIDEYLRERLMPVEGAIPHIAGIEMYGNSIPAGTVGGDLFEYINFQQRCLFTSQTAVATTTVCQPHLSALLCIRHHFRSNL